MMSVRGERVSCESLDAVDYVSHDPLTYAGVMHFFNFNIRHYPRLSSYLHFESGKRPSRPLAKNVAIESD